MLGTQPMSSHTGNGTTFCNARQWLGPNVMGETEGDDSSVQYYDTIAFIPNSSSAVVELMDLVRNETLPFFSSMQKNVSFVALASNTDFKAIVRDESTLLFAAVVFTNPEELTAPSGQTPEYLLRMPSDLPDKGQRDTRWATKLNFPEFETVGIRLYQDIPYTSPSSYLYYGGSTVNRQNNG